MRSSTELSLTALLTLVVALDDDWIAAQGEGGREHAYAVHLPSERSFVASPDSHINYPDLYIDP